MKTTKIIGFSNQNENKGGIVPNPDHEIKKMKQKHNTCKQESNKILLPWKNKFKTRLLLNNVPKTNVEQTKRGEEFYPYLYPLGT